MKSQVRVAAHKVMQEKPLVQTNQPSVLTPVMTRFFASEVWHYMFLELGLTSFLCVHCVCALCELGHLCNWTLAVDKKFL